MGKTKRDPRGRFNGSEPSNLGKDNIPTVSTLPKVINSPKGLSSEMIARNEEIVRARFLKNIRKQKTTVPELRKEMESRWNARTASFRRFCKTKRILERQQLSTEELALELGALSILVNHSRMEWEVVGEVYDEVRGRSRDTLC